VPDGVLFDAMGGLVDSIAVDEESLGCRGVLGIEDPVWSCFTVNEEVVCGATDTVAVWLRGPEERLDGAVAIFAISRPSSPTRPWSSDISSRISCRSFRTSGALLGGSCGGGGVVFFSFSLSTNHFSTSFIRSSKART